MSRQLVRLLVFLLLCGSSCVDSDIVRSEPPVQDWVSQDQATVVFLYAKEDNGYRGPLSIFTTDDLRFLGVVNHGSYFVTRLPPGPHVFSTVIPRSNLMFTKMAMRGLVKANLAKGRLYVVKVIFENTYETSEFASLLPVHPSEASVTSIHQQLLSNQHVKSDLATGQLEINETFSIPSQKDDFKAYAVERWAKHEAHGDGRKYSLLPEDFFSPPPGIR